MESPKAVISLVHERISEIASENPDSIALSLGSSDLSYGELDRRATRITSYLNSIDIGLGNTVAICMERSLDWIVSALGILRAGAAYVPLDPTWAAERLRFAIENSDAKLVIARAGVLQSIGLELPGLDPASNAELLKSPLEFSPERIPAEALAYVIYTSGSSGVPKGVEITHGNLLHLIKWHTSEFQVEPQDRVSHIAGLGFDAAVWELWPALASGATVCIVNDDIRASPILIQKWILDSKITISFIPTAIATTLITLDWPEETKLRLLLTGGDTLPHGPKASLPFVTSNNYGPTECTVVATSGIVTPDISQSPSIGRPIMGTSIYLLNEQKELVPEGGVGEIYIGGGGVGRGYRDLPELTQLYFLPDPFAISTGGRMYRTGDLGLRLESGEIQFRGRLDRQIKIRGQRIELDEISSTLARHPNLEFATAVALVSEKGSNELIAYVLPKEKTTVVTVSELQRHLLKSLPNYMIPSVFVRLAALPLSPNGKVDLTLLERPTPENLIEASLGRLSATPIEERVLAMVQDILESRTVTLEDDFFLVGGHSLVGMQLVLRLRESFDVDFTLRELFAASTVEKLASAVEEKLIAAIEELSDEEADMELPNSRAT